MVGTAGAERQGSKARTMRTRSKQGQEARRTGEGKELWESPGYRVVQLNAHQFNFLKGGLYKTYKSKANESKIIKNKRVTRYIDTFQNQILFRLSSRQVAA